VRRCIWVSADAASTMYQAAHAGAARETGGILVGYREPKQIVVTHALHLPPVHGQSDRYTRDETAANLALGLYLEGRESDDPEGYVGEWHSHPGPSGPSPIDLKAVREIADLLGDSVALIVVRVTRWRRLAGIIAGVSRVGRSFSRPAVVKIAGPQINREGTK
jgi:proteasome lid subunit RPN8/RPN11